MSALDNAIAEKYKAAAFTYWQTVKNSGETSTAAALAAARLLARGDLARLAGFSEFKLAKLLYEAQQEVGLMVEAGTDDY